MSKQLKSVKYFKLYSFYATIYALLMIFSYGFVNIRSPFPKFPVLDQLIYRQRFLATAVYCGLVIGLFAIYIFFLKKIEKKDFTARIIWRIIFLGIVILFFAYPAFSYDLFNYMATSRVTFLYKENPYLVMPLEITNEPMLKFMHAANKTALYGPVWILLTSLPHWLGKGNLFLSIFTFKALVVSFYLLLVWLIWKLSNKNLWSLAFFALNPLVVIETLVNGHNDVVMMALAILSFSLLKRKKLILSFLALTASVLIKFATVCLVPVWIYAFWLMIKGKKINWSKVWLGGTGTMLMIFLLSPLREELYSWYLIWPLSLVVFLPQKKILLPVLTAFSFGLMFRFAPFLYFDSWSGLTPKIKTIVSFVPPILVFLFLQMKKWKKGKFLL